MKMRNIGSLAVFGILAVSAVAADETWTYDGEAALIDGATWPRLSSFARSARNNRRSIWCVTPRL
ncbi:hypothetical protein [Devosia faecipullorum]|uniref:hypothetical protein n=1 Tax=Devosia faecipullorum TaxID=2755039 RepID=UPI00187BC37C|nr:hypothetical protein [Devosia faecipullorum]MBE7732334.1 hypothetical protein [Devosia faecipullorum]